MTWFSGITASYVSDFRCKRKFHGYLFLACALLLIVVPVNSRPKETESDVVVPVEDGLPLSEEYGDADNIEFHQAKMVNGILKEDHPVIMYKEDFVSEDFVPKKNNTHRQRKHKDPAHRRRRIGDHLSAEKYHPLEPEKIYFDILSPSPLVTSDESKAASSKLHVEVISLADADSKMVQSEDEVKRVLHKRPKKFHHRRQRRDADTISQTEHILRKRNPYYSFRKVSTNANSISGPAHIANYYLPSYPPVKRFEKHPVPGDYFNGPVNVIQFASRFGGPSNTDRVIWRDYTPTRNPNQRLNITIGAPAPLFPKRTSPSPLPAVTAGPPSRTTAQPSFANEGSVHHSVITDAPAQYPTAAPPKPPSSSSACVWAIASCCSPNDRTVRYSCFERYGCNLVFFDLNPCADNIRDNIIGYLNQQFE
ncbi:uncharacterized protein LOC118736844 isoform X1 [Rhagoletis pomonella]|uniref:uncharacterized protein LOC118736844 isoform X1 n=1 Tax=Rhagoletis pomonella TaxID=28610 RepID=UPI0017870FB1|nr:uncharacterized protein LOC118736844 isoform X1 [Rhagoletis pomonella]XP_036322799.1 uncharacterized protein LOC118736844 isoform X1 [Rhagoletis pomonella]XP_036322800.1 uncharacterized protein LOC118736844 isoform X1 [Rhagoletis pomonella]